MSPLALGPVLMLLGLVAAYFTLRTRARVKKSMYRKLRDQRERQIKIARQRAHDAKLHAEQAEFERVAAERAAAQAATKAAEARVAATDKNVAAAGTATAEPLVTAKVEEPPAAPSLVWDETAAPPAASAPAPAPPEPVTPPPAEPVWEPTSPITAKSDSEPEPLPEPMPVAAAPEPEPEPELEPEGQPNAEMAGGAGWEIVESVKPDQKPAAEVAADVDHGRATWELPATDSVDPKKGRREKQPTLPREIGESPLQVIMSYAGLVAALLVIMLGILFMVGARG
jgi:hypothetical protein